MMRAVRRIVFGVLLVSLVLAGCGGEVDPARTGAGAAQVRFFEDLYAGKFGQVYATLHPDHQKLVSRELFVRCAKDATAVGKLDSVEVLDVFDETVSIPELGKLRVKAVRVRITSTSGDTSTVVNHEVKVGEQWRWVLNDAAARAYQSGSCT
jgi:hypothetical protein